jgi:hypothetical protein
MIERCPVNPSVAFLGPATLWAGLWLPAPSVAPAWPTDREAARQESSAAADFTLDPVSPNPFERETRISFRLGERLFEGEGEVRVTMRVFNILRQVVAVPVALDERGRPDSALEDMGYERPGYYEAFWDGRDREGRLSASGPYFVELRVGDQAQVRKILLVPSSEGG